METSVPVPQIGDLRGRHISTRRSWPPRSSLADPRHTRKETSLDLQGNVDVTIPQKRMYCREFAENHEPRGRYRYTDTTVEERTTSEGFPRMSFTDCQETWPLG
jgi:hypothetical protein